MLEVRVIEQQAGPAIHGGRAGDEARGETVVTMSIFLVVVNVLGYLFG